MEILWGGGGAADLLVVLCCVTAIMLPFSLVAGIIGVRLTASDFRSTVFDPVAETPTALLFPAEHLP